jgi:Protein of unknown function (DUF2630)
MDDDQILKRIGDLVSEEHAILERDGSGSPGSDDHSRLRALQVTLDQCWDLLRQRRAHREFGQDPDQAQARDATTVERYQQ